ncbi:CBS-domain-containing protein [Hypoxylon sp. FL1284]|nr:CBS-domain-containing protein [Hypoxylon sp. FL1284]
MDDPSSRQPSNYRPGDEPQRASANTPASAYAYASATTAAAAATGTAAAGAGATPAIPSALGFHSTIPLPRAGHELPFVQPSSYLRPKIRSRTVPTPTTPMTPIDEEQLQGLKGLRNFLRVRTSYDVLPLSFRLIVLDNDLLIRKSLDILIQNGIVSAPLWDSHQSRFAGLLTATDYINLIQYYCQFPEHIDDVDKFRLSSLRDIEKAIGVLPLETISVHPTRPLYEACSRMLKSRARRIPLVDIDHETERETVVSVITQYRILKFIAVNTEQHTMLLKQTVREIGLGTYKNLATTKMTDSVLEVINLMVVHNISAVPIVDKNNVVLNVFEAVDVIPCIKGGVYEELKSTVGDALSRRPEDFQGIYTCQEDDRLDSIFTTLRQSRVHRLVVIDDNWHLKGMISLSDILKYVLFTGVSSDEGEYFPPPPPPS